MELADILTTISLSPAESSESIKQHTSSYCQFCSLVFFNDLWWPPKLFTYWKPQKSVIIIFLKRWINTQFFRHEGLILLLHTFALLIMSQVWYTAKNFCKRLSGPLLIITTFISLSVATVWLLFWSAVKSYHTSLEPNLSSIMERINVVQLFVVVVPIQPSFSIFF